MSISTWEHPDPCRGSDALKQPASWPICQTPTRGFDGVVIGGPQRAFYGNQFSLTFPVFTHYGVQLWVPEVGGPIDPGSEAHDLVMTLFGGMSKGERSRIQVRTRAAMRDLASRTDRFLGGRPPSAIGWLTRGPTPTLEGRPRGNERTASSPTKMPPRSCSRSSRCTWTAWASEQLPNA